MDCSVPQRTLGAQARSDKRTSLVQIFERGLPDSLFRRARAAIGRLGGERLKQSYWTTFWMPLDDHASALRLRPAPRRAGSSAPHHALEEAVLALAPLALGGRRALGAEWWIGRTYTTRVPIEFHFDQDVKLRDAGGPLVHPLASSVLFFNSVRGGQLAVTDQRPDDRGDPRPARPRALEAVKPRANRYAVFAGDRYHGVLDANGEMPTRALAGPRGRLRITLVVNFWRRRPTDVLTWSESRVYRALQGR
jgi:hypothetical protein